MIKEETFLVKRNQKETNEEFKIRVERLREDTQNTSGRKTTAHKLGGAVSGGVKGASRYIITTW